MTMTTPAPFLELGHKVVEFCSMNTKQLNEVRQQWNSRLPRADRIKQGKNLLEKRFNLLSEYMFHTTPVSVRVSEHTWIIDAVRSTGNEWSGSPLISIWYGFEVVKDYIGNAPYVDWSSGITPREVGFHLFVYMLNFLADLKKNEEKFKNFPNSVRHECYMSGIREIKPRLC